MRPVTVLLATFVAGPLWAALLGGGCAARPAAGRPQDHTFQTLRRLLRQIDALPDTGQRDELADTAGLLESQILFGPMRMPATARLLLVQEIQISPMTQVGDWDNDGQSDGFEVFVTALDGYGDPTKVVGRFYFELFPFQAAHAERKGLQRTCYWEQDVLSRQQNVDFWDRLGRTYRFNLAWDSKPSAGHKFVLQATYVAPWGETKQAQRTLTAVEIPSRMPDTQGK